MTRYEQGIYKLYIKINAAVIRENYFNNNKIKQKTMYQLPTISQELTKTQLKIIADTSLTDILNGGNIIEIADLISKMEFFFKELKTKKEYIEYLRSEVEKYGKAHITKSGTKIELAEVGTKYDFSKCGDLKLLELENDLIRLEEKITERKEFLKSLPYGGMEILQGDEILTFTPPNKTSTSSVKVTLKA